jgi:pimeloyl-ACP methyl ester carboxylesterase
VSTSPPHDLRTFDLSVQGSRLRAQTLRPGAGPVGPTLVFLHEALGSIAQWRDFPRVLAEASGLPALVYDRQGHGQSDPLALPRPLDYLEHEARTVLPGVLAACGITRPIFFGHSDGGTIALLHAAAFPGIARGLMVEAAHVFVEDLTLDGVRAAVQAFASGQMKGLERHHGVGAEALFRAWSQTWLHPGFRTWSMVDLLSAIQVPVLALQGKDDQYGTPAQLQIIQAGVQGPCEGYLLPDCGHVPHFQARDRVLAEALRFLERLAPDF